MHPPGHSIDERTVFHVTLKALITILVGMVPVLASIFMAGSYWTRVDKMDAKQEIMMTDITVIKQDMAAQKATLNLLLRRQINVGLGRE